MILRVFAVAVPVVACAGGAAAQVDSPVSYTVAPVMEGAALRALAVEIRFAGDADGETRLDLPGQWAGTDSLWKQVDEVRVQGAASVREAGAEARIITHAPGAALAVRYRVRSPYTEEPGFGYEKALPVILPGWFFFHGEGVFAAPEGREDAPARFAWSGFPAGWKMASDLDHLAGARPGTVTDVVQSVAIGAPDLTLVRREIGGAPLQVAIRGEWDFAPEAFTEAVIGVVQAENAFWGDAGRPFVVPMASMGPSAPGLSYTGTGRGDAFSVASTAGFPLGDASRFLAHEYMHTWIGEEIGGSPDDAASAFWITEGFTDFYAGRVLLRAGLWTPAEYVAELNRVLMRNANSPARAIPNAAIGEKFWTDNNVQQLPYDRGHLLALLLDHRIRAHTGGRADMDDVMLAQRALARRNTQAQTPVDAAALFPIVARQELGMDLGAELARHVERGEPVSLPADLFGGCARVGTITQPEFHRGFDLAATEANGMVITGMDPASPGYAAGMRDGMRIIRREAGTPGNSAVEIAYRVNDAGTERVFRYLPLGRGSVSIQRFVLTPEGSSERCVRLMSGA
ncbi:M61 family peptidase [Longimicrobium sp.]|uniref:M61 family metallopeptidase n=1 Tax=Longimicrobium sp. TaxID=2029185 RepID=UPI003B3A3306